MARSSLAAALIVAMAIGISGRAPVLAQETSSLEGRWTLDRELSQFPREIGFDPDFLTGSGSGPGATASGGRGRNRFGQGSSPLSLPESEEDARRVQQLTDEVRTPSAALTIVDAPAAVTITNDGGQSRTFHPNGKEDVLQLGQTPVAVTATRAAGRLVVLYHVEDGRELRYTYSRTANPPQLAVDVAFIERGRTDSVRRVYLPAAAPELLPPGAGVSDSAKAATSAPADRGQPPTATPLPDPELRGLTELGVVVEDLSAQAAACGLNQGAIAGAVSKSLSDGGLTVVRNVDRDPYVYVNVVTSSLSPGLCVSRYDAFLYTYTTTKLSYHETPVLVQVSLLHKGGMSGGAPAAHADGVLRGVKEYVDQFVTRIRDANK